MLRHWGCWIEDRVNASARQRGSNREQFGISDLYDAFGVLRYEQGSAETPWRQVFFKSADEELATLGNSAVLYITSTGLSNPTVFALFKLPRLKLPSIKLPRLPVPPLAIKICLLCLAGFAPGAIPYFSDCFSRFNDMQCWIDYAKIFIGECMKQTVCGLVLMGCGYACGITFRGYYERRKEEVAKQPKSPDEQ